MAAENSNKLKLAKIKNVYLYFSKTAKFFSISGVISAEKM